MGILSGIKDLLSQDLQVDFSNNMFNKLSKKRPRSSEIDDMQKRHHL